MRHATHFCRLAIAGASSLRGRYRPLALGRGGQLAPTGIERRHRGEFLVKRFLGMMTLLALVMSAAGCGYRVAGRASKLSPSVRTIAVPALENKTTRYRIEQRLTEALVKEFLSRTTYRVVPDPGQADAVLRGKIVGIESSAILFDVVTARATTLLVTVRTEVVLEERETHAVLYRNDNFLFRNQYEISTDVASFFEEQDPALDRLARDFAARLVSSIVENF